MPGVAYRPISYDGVPKMSRYDIVCIHTIVGHDPAAAAHFSTGSGGTITQSRDTLYQSAANLNGNHRVIAIENEDFGPEYGPWSGSDVPAFTAAQCEAIARVCVWAHQVHGVPLELCPDSRPGSRGIGYHRQGIDGNWAGFAYGGRIDGGEVWTKSPGKVCPGDRRITQLINVIIPRARVLAGLQEDDDMQLNDQFPIQNDERTYGEGWRNYQQIIGSTFFWAADTHKYARQAVEDLAQVKATQAQILAAQHGDLSADEIMRRLEESSRQGSAEGAARAITENVLPAINQLKTLLQSDNVDEAKAVVDELVARLRPAA